MSEQGEASFSQAAQERVAGVGVGAKIETSPVRGLFARGENAGAVVASMTPRRSGPGPTPHVRVLQRSCVHQTGSTSSRRPHPDTHTLLVRCSIAAPLEVEFFLAHVPVSTAVTEVIDAAGMRWRIEENNEHGKDLLGLTQYQVRKWTPWHRHVTTCMLALAFLAVMRAPCPPTLMKPLTREKTIRSWRHHRAEAPAAVSGRDPSCSGPAVHPRGQCHRSCPGLVGLPAASPDAYPDQPLSEARQPTPSGPTNVVPVYLRGP